MGTQKSRVRYTKKERAHLEVEAAKFAQLIAEKKEQVRWLSVVVERQLFKTRHNHKRLQVLKVRSLGIEDANERSKTNAEIQDIERGVDDLLFSIKEQRSRLRRVAKLIQELEYKLIAIRKTAAAKKHVL